MQSRLPKNDDRYQWTNHVVQKMRHYGLSEGRVRRVVASPKRKEEGIAPGTVAVMQSAGSPRHPYEVWVMYQELNSKIKNQNVKLRKSKFEILRVALTPVRKRIITAWRYPGVSKPRDAVPIPEEILQELDELV
ncbi:MAG: hypothetical protein A3C11_00400 [Candidatus Sungbacteria bacterium RIFCSPHIGHO2_02_FULL_49_12]|uniref:Uncharacterized protein n=2 Tax=Parcubacteria group TaxID=1794811 RepID=A0A1G2CI59_9BACT|nr:MAG: hypothetical protein A2945_00730 [Candidatus Liptonbacteria bacterium RIFCSPLOWO2_01_FULL_52_25]OHA01266.1 MAG: hypothetical protein A3C11_00400 [Candidatus Sungbacteria bacterium RIFCSPHIGHO2_02_FULL_49_12]